MYRWALVVTGVDAIALVKGYKSKKRSALGAVIQHVSLRFVLHRAGLAPWNYARFLEHAENHRFIQRVSGRYRFVHDLSRSRFAERYQTMNQQR